MPFLLWNSFKSTPSSGFKAVLLSLMNSDTFIIPFPCPRFILRGRSRDFLMNFSNDPPIFPFPCLRFILRGRSRIFDEFFRTMHSTFLSLVLRLILRGRSRIFDEFSIVSQKKVSSYLIFYQGKLILDDSGFRTLQLLPWRRSFEHQSLVNFIFAQIYDSPGSDELVETTDLLVVRLF